MRRRCCCCALHASLTLRFARPSTCAVLLRPPKKISKHAAPLLDALDKEYDTPAEGSGFFALHSCINHSCAPNAAAEGEPDGGAAFVSLRPIAAGEEITLSYIDEEAPRRDRQRALADYGFVCACARCEEEKPRAGGGRRGGAGGRRGR